MNSEDLLRHYERVADAPGAVEQLRRFVMELAVRGKLVRQISTEQPAAGLLDRIAAGKASMVNAGISREGSEYPGVLAQEEPFAIPDSWRWVRFANLASFTAGRTPSRHDASFWDNKDHPWVSIADMVDGRVLTTTRESVSEKASQQVFGSRPEPPGTIIMSFKLTIGKIARLGIDAYHNEAIIAIKPYLAELDSYLFKVLPKFARQGNTKGAIKGATLNRDSISNILVPLPPLAEQHRIVVKVDELMAVCDRLAAARASREAARDWLAAASLARLNAPDPETFHEDARFALDALPALTTRLDQIKQLRQTILNLGLLGKLVGQLQSDEPASLLLARLSNDIEAYRQEHRLTSGSGDPIPDQDKPLALPDGWLWVRLASLFRIITDGDHQPPPKAEDGVAFLTIGNVTTGRLDFSGCRFVPAAYFEALAPYRVPRLGDILYTVVGATFGRPSLVETAQDFCVQRHIAILKPAGEVNLRFLFWLLSSPLVYDQAARSTTGTAQPTIALRPLRNFVVPLPPLAEQHRIVAKVDQLMALCDRLEASLVSTDTHRRRLLEALLRETLQPANAMEEAA